MNTVDSILKTTFSRLPIEEKLEIKRLGPYQPDNFILEQQCKSRKRSFRSDWYKEFEWLTVSEEKKKLFCFYCLLFGGSTVDTAWSRIGFNDIQHFTNRARSHERKEGHLNNAVRFKTFGHQPSILGK